MLVRRRPLTAVPLREPQSSTNQRPLSRWSIAWTRETDGSSTMTSLSKARCRASAGRPRVTGLGAHCRPTSRSKRSPPSCCTDHNGPCRDHESRTLSNRTGSPCFAVRKSVAPAITNAPCEAHRGCSPQGGRHERNRRSPSTVTSTGSPPCCSSVRSSRRSHSPSVFAGRNDAPATPPAPVVHVGCRHRLCPRRARNEDLLK